MSEPLVSACKSIVLTSSNPDATAAFYREVLGLPLEEENHRGTTRHWACQLGSIHFAIHQAEGFWLTTRPLVEGDTIVSFTVGDIEVTERKLAERGVPILGRNKVGPMSFLALRDPDGRHVCLGTPWPSGKRAVA